ncbi:C4-dicarboxylate transporter DctM subunit [Amorphus sp. MBR-141]
MTAQSTPIERGPSVQFDAFCRRVTQYMAMAGVLGMLAIAILTTVDILVFRYLLNAPIPGSNEILSTVFAVAVAAVLPSGLAQKGMLEVDILAGSLGPRRSAWLRVVTGALFAVALAVVAWQVVVFAQEAHASGRQTVILQWKTWPFLAVIAAIFVACVPVQIASVARSVDSLFAGTGDGASGSRLGRIGFWVAIAAAVAVVWYLLDLYGGSMRGTAAMLSIVIFAALWLLVAGLAPVALALLLCGFVGTSLIMGIPIALNIVGSETTALITSSELAVLPLFLIMGGLATASGMANDLFRLAAAVFGFQRGGLALATIGGAAGFGALTGSSLATVATIGRAALPEMEARGYSKSLSTGCIAAGGCLGQIIPPSTAAVLYAILVEQSIGMLYIALLVPALLSIVFYLGSTWMIIYLRPESAPGRVPFDARELMRALWRSVSAFIMFGTVIGGIFTGVFTATEAAAVGVLIAFLVALFRGKLRADTIRELIVETTQATAMLYFVLIGANVFSFFIGAAGLPGLLTQSLLDSGLAPLAIIALLAVAYLLLGSVMDAFTILLVTAPIVSGMIATLGYDLLWWGVVMVVVIEIGVISPPFGMNLFVMKSVAKDVSLMTIYRGVLPFVFADIIKLALLVLFPALSLWLPLMAMRN